jgi:hypothetical protein
LEFLKVRILFWRAAALLALVLAVGCSTEPRMDYSSVNLVDAYGKVTLDGQPLPSAVVTFETPDGQFSYGMTDASGEYSLQFDSAVSGVTPGAKIVRISTTRKILGLNADDGEGEQGSEAPSEDGAKAPAAEERVPAKYNKDSELKIEVTPGQREYNFDLTS